MNMTQEIYSASATQTRPREDVSDMPSVTPVFRIANLKRHFDVSPPLLNRLLERKERQVVKAVDGVSFDIYRGETFSLVGESGCGKSTIAKLVVGLNDTTSGNIEFEGEDIATHSRQDMDAIRHRLQMIFQDPYASLNPRWRVRNIIAEPLTVFGLLDGQKAIDERVATLLECVGLNAQDGEKYPHEFSGGQRQRISIARALASNPEFIVCDEPTSALDVSVQAQILNLMKDLQREFALTYLFISHDLSVVYHISDRIGVMYLGRLVEVGTKHELFRRPQHPYTRMLLDSIPDLKMTGRARTPVGGEVPSPLDPPSGCAFHPRCPHANARCKREAPRPLHNVERGFVACHAVEEGRLITRA
ncbi:ABC transporter ATP-binding protein [Halomonas stenophila]|uniref:Peptide/nickel transport system ATP-binding protein n=1 Tax=Halomonas stenophila TaxID=795312 RepID=A0A7W5EU33_9GAMM|nr:oligopeptide/dipeptide ABC transporter ATP-binding protein [Halomonas stenophila]MBB3231453.1 peptide/nickel transport system ATP-binding protein [Halomonas stenophila]